MHVYDAIHVSGCPQVNQTVMSMQTASIFKQPWLKKNQLMLETHFSKMDFSKCHFNFTADLESLLKVEVCHVKILSSIQV